MIHGIGTDVVYITRIETLLKNYPTKLPKRLLSRKENDVYLELAHHQKASFIAKRFAAKEAVAKAIGSGIMGPLKFIDIEILNEANGKPFVYIHEDLNIRLGKKLLSEYQIHISISDNYPIAIAFATISL